MKKFFLDLGMQPLANNYRSRLNDKQDKYNLKLFFDTKTKLVSISKRIPSKIMFDNKYPYKSSMSKTMQKSFKILSDDLKKRFDPHLLLEIGSNDGALIKNFKVKNVIAIEPCKNLANITNKMGYKTFNNYWNLNTSNKVRDKFDKVDLVYSANTITHISNLNEVFKSIINILSDDGVLIIEDPSLLACLKKVSYDQFYNEHIHVFSALSLKNIIKKFKLELFDIKHLNTHGGSLRYFIKKSINKKIKIKISVKNQINNELAQGLDNLKVYKKFALNSLKSRNKLVKLFDNIKIKKKKIIGYGATAKATTVLNFCNIDNNKIDYFVDTTPDKANKYMPGTKIKIFKYNERLIHKADYIFLGAWNFKDEIFEKEISFIKKGGRFISHVPKPKIIK